MNDLNDVLKDGFFIVRHGGSDESEYIEIECLGGDSYIYSVKYDALIELNIKHKMKLPNELPMCDPLYKLYGNLK